MNEFYDKLINLYYDKMNKCTYSFDGLDKFHEYSTKIRHLEMLKNIHRIQVAAENKISTPDIPKNISKYQSMLEIMPKPILYSVLAIGGFCLTIGLINYLVNRENDD